MKYLVAHKIKDIITKFSYKKQAPFRFGFIADSIIEYINKALKKSRVDAQSNVFC